MCLIQDALPQAASGMMTLMPDDAEPDPTKFFRDLGFDLQFGEHDLHAEHMARGEPGRASFFAEGRTYYCVDLLRRDGSILATRYGYGETVEEALARARSRFLSEQR